MQTRYVVRSTFGGVEDAFLASGGEDCCIYVWRADSREVVSCLTGHSGAVNAVAWNPKEPGMMASASDDGTVRIWLSKNKSIDQY